MKTLNNTRYTILLSALLSVGFLGGCTKVTSVNVGGVYFEELRTMRGELDHVEKLAKSLSQNDLGYYEADFGNGIVMIYVPSGTFTIGNNALPDASPEHNVTLSHYWISKTPVTIGQYRKFVTATNYITDVEKPESRGSFVYDFDDKGFVEKTGYRWDNSFKDVIERYPEITVNDEHPVNSVSWNDVIAYTDWFSKITGAKFTLPSEAEWEYAARGSDGRVYPWGNENPDGQKANYADETFDRYFPDTGQSIVHKGVNDGYAITSPVGRFPLGRSPIGALDMAGNVTEWVFDSYYDYTSEPKTDPIFTGDPNSRMMKAGFWAGSAGRMRVKPDEIVDGHNIRADARQSDDTASADDHLGFRIAISYTNREIGTD